jgi:hypothetical protein
MKKSINDNQKRRGRPATGTAPLVGVRMTLEFQEPIRAWAKAQEDCPSMAEAIRRLVKIGLRVNAPARAARSTPNKLRAQELAAKVIEKLADPAAAPEERDQRRRRLTKGPTEFREHRVDLPKAKGK